MAKRQFKAESKRLLDLMIHSIYTHKEIFLRELISNASDAIDKIYYKALTDDSISFNKDDYFIKINVNKATRTLTISDTGIGMTNEELADNLGVIANSGTFKFKEDIEKAEDHDIIGQFGVGFYSAFMVASKVTVTTKALGSDKAFKWVSTGAEGYTISEAEKDTVGTDIEIIVKENSDEENYDDYLDTYRLQMIVKKYSDFIRYPIKMDLTKQVPVEGKEGEFTEEIEEKTVNSMVPIWRKNKSELSDEDYETFYQEKHYGYDKPARHLHIKAEGASTRYAAILYIPQQMPYDFYTKEYEKGLELYASGVMIMKKCGDLLPDYFAFVQGLVDSEDLSLNISREMLQHDRQLKVIAKNIKSKIKSDLEKMMESDREGYEEFFKAFGRQLKYGVYDSFGANKEDLQGLLMFYSSTEEKLVSLSEYIGRMKEDQKYIYYASGESVDKIKLLPQTERVADAGYEILYFTDDIDEFAINVLSEYEAKTFKNVNSGDLGIEEKEDDKPAEEKEENQKIFDAMQEVLGDKVTKVKASTRLASTAVCLSTEGGITIEMEKILSAMPNNEGTKAERVLEINTDHTVFEALKKAKDSDEEKFGMYTALLYNQAVLMEGLSVDNPVEFSKDICKLIK